MSERLFEEVNIEAIEAVDQSLLEEMRDELEGALPDIVPFEPSYRLMELARVVMEREAAGSSGVGINMISDARGFRDQLHEEILSLPYSDSGDETPDDVFSNVQEAISEVIGHYIEGHEGYHYQM